MRVLAIGATGFIGRHVLPLLLETSVEDAVLHRGETGADLPAGVRRIRGNRNRLDLVKTEMERFAPDVVLDAILYTEQQARAVVEAARSRVGTHRGVGALDAGWHGAAELQ